MVLESSIQGLRWVCVVIVVTAVILLAARRHLLWTPGETALMVRPTMAALPVQHASKAAGVDDQNPNDGDSNYQQHLEESSREELDAISRLSMIDELDIDERMSIEKQETDWLNEAEESNGGVERHMQLKEPSGENSRRQQSHLGKQPPPPPTKH